MNTYQTVFTLFFALYFALTITLTGKLQLFDTPSLCNLRPHGYPRAWLRFIFAIIVLDICPILFFWWVFMRLHNISNQSPNLVSIVLLFWSSLIGQGIYRLIYGFMIIKVKGKYLFYDRDLYKQENNWLPIGFHNELNERPSTHQIASKHIIPGLLWIISAILAALLIS